MRSNPYRPLETVAALVIGLVLGAAITAAILFAVGETVEHFTQMSDLILAVGDENVVFQMLDRDAQTIDKTKYGTKISFYTDAIQAEELLGDGKTDKMGLVLWLPRARVDAAVAAEKAARTPAAVGISSVEK